MKKVAFVCPDAFTVWIFRKGLAQALIERGYSVHVLAKSDDYVQKLQGIGVIFHPISFERFISVRQDFKIIRELWLVFRNENFDIVHNFTIKPNIYSAILARIAGVRDIYNSVTGLGIVYQSEFRSDIKERLSKSAIALLYRFGSLAAKKTWFQNQDDVDYFLQRHLIHKSKTIMIRSSGINTTEWRFEDYKESPKKFRQELNLPSNQFLVIMVARALKEKGVDAFIEAARGMEKSHPNISFVLVGGTEENGHLGLSRRDLLSLMHRKGSNFFWLGHRHDVKHIHASANVSVLPSYYREGVPRSLLESMAMGKPIVTSNSVGCKETVKHGYNGFMIPVRSSNALKEAIVQLYDDPILTKEMGENSLSRVKSLFEESYVVGRLLREMYNI